MPESSPARRRSHVALSVPMTTSGSALRGALADAGAVGGAADLPGVADVAEAHLVGRRRSPAPRRDTAPGACGRPPPRGGDGRRQALTQAPRRHPTPQRGVHTCSGRQNIRLGSRGDAQNGGKGGAAEDPLRRATPSGRRSGPAGGAVHRVLRDRARPLASPWLAERCSRTRRARRRRSPRAAAPTPTRASAPRSTPIPYASADALLARREPRHRRARRDPGPAEPRGDRPLGRGRRRRRGSCCPSGARPRSRPRRRRRRRGRSSSCRSRASATSRTSWRTRRRAGRWVYGADAGGDARYDEPDYAGGRRAGAGGRGKGAAAARGRGLRPDRLDPAPRSYRVAQCVRRGCHHPVRNRP